MFGRLFPKKKTISPRQSRRVQLMVEHLETRLVPASNAFNLTGNTAGTLTITELTPNGTGDEDLNIAQQADGTTYVLTETHNTDTFTTGTSGSLTFSAAGATVTVSNVTNIVVDMNTTAGNDDTVTLDGDATTLSGFLTVNEAVSGSTLNVDDSSAAFNVAGAVSISTTGTDVLKSDLTLPDNFGSLTVSGGKGGSTLSFDTITSDDFVTVSFTGGTNSTTLEAATINGAVTYKGGTTSDTLVLDDDTIAGAVSVTFAGASGDTLEVEDGTLSSTLTVTSSGTADTYDIEGGAQITGYVSLNCSGKGTTVDLDDATLDSFLSVTLGAGTNSITADDGTAITGDFVYGFSGKATVDIGGSGTLTTIGGNLVQSDLGGITSETLDIGGAAGDLNIAGSVSISAASASGSVVVTVDGDATDTTSAPTIAGSLSIATGKGADTICIQNQAVIGGLFDYDLGTGAGVVQIDGPDTILEGSVQQFDGGAGVTTQTFALTNGATVGGWVALNATQATGKYTVVIDGSSTTAPGESTMTIGSFLSVATGTGNDLIVINSAQIGSAFGFNTGAGNDTIAMNNTTINGNVFGNMGTGSNQLLLEVDVTALEAAAIAGLPVTPTESTTTPTGSVTFNGSSFPTATDPLNFINMGTGTASVELGTSSANQFVYGFNNATAPFTILATGGTLNQHISGNVATSDLFTAFPAPTSSVPDVTPGLQNVGFTTLI